SSKKDDKEPVAKKVSGPFDTRVFSMLIQGVRGPDTFFATGSKNSFLMRGAYEIPWVNMLAGTPGWEKARTGIGTCSDRRLWYLDHVNGKRKAQICQIFFFRGLSSAGRVLSTVRQPTGKLRVTSTGGELIESRSMFLL